MVCAKTSHDFDQNFTWSGYLGNTNRFDSQSECEESCNVNMDQVNGGSSTACRLSIFLVHLVITNLFIRYPFVIYHSMLVHAKESLRDSTTTKSKVSVW